MEFVTYRDDDGQWCWRLMGADDEILASSSQSYPTKDECHHTIFLVTQCHNAPIVEED